MDVGWPLFYIVVVGLAGLVLLAHNWLQFFLIKVFRRWCSRNELVTVFIHSRRKHTESAVLVDNAGSAYQITLSLQPFPLQPVITVSEYVPETREITQQRVARVWFTRLRRELDAAFRLLQSWMGQHYGRRLGREEDLKLAKTIFQGAKQAMPTAPRQEPPVRADLY